MKKTVSALLLSLLFFTAVDLKARQFHDIDFAENLVLPDTEQTLQLNGIGYRSKFFIKVYIGALYTESRAGSRAEVQAQKGPKRLLMHFVYDEVAREKLVSAWNEGFEENTPKQGLAALAERIAGFNAMFPSLRAGDVVLLDYIPGKGTRVTIKGEDKGLIPGEDFNHALLDIWLGEEPADSGLKDALLGEQ